MTSLTWQVMRQEVEAYGATGFAGRDRAAWDAARLKELGASAAKVWVDSAVLEACACTHCGGIERTTRRGARRA